jgi:hypothetical protein
MSSPCVFNSSHGIRFVNVVSHSSLLSNYKQAGGTFMPTGYTHDISKGISFREFILNCARAFGACIMMRDDPSDTPIPERFEPSDYHTKELKRVEKELAELKDVSDATANTLAKKEFEKETTDLERIIREKGDLRNKYEVMLSQVNAWIPPTTEHNGLHKFMRDQITESIKFDCETSYYLDKKPILLSGEQWRAKRLKSLLSDLDYHKREHAEEVSRTESRNDWIKKLRESLPVEIAEKRTTGLQQTKGRKKV